MKVWVLIIDTEVCGVFKNAEDAFKSAKVELHDHACDYNYPITDYAEALDNLYNTFDQKDSTGYFGTFLLDWEISVTESELS